LMKEIETTMLSHHEELLKKKPKIIEKETKDISLPKETTPEKAPITDVIKTTTPRTEVSSKTRRMSDEKKENEVGLEPFYLVDQGYDVWLGNNRCVYDRHMELTTSDPAYWDWTLDDLARYDFPATVKFVAKQTQQKIVYCGHSQGNAQAFAGLSINPELANYILLFVAMAPAYFLNEFDHWSLRTLANLSDKYYSHFFGTKSFIPIMHLCQYYLHQRIFSSFAYNMFAYLFGWTSERWQKGKKPAIFMTTPRPISTKLIQHWLKISKSGKLISYTNDEPYLLEHIKCPVAVFWGKGDGLVDGKKLVESLYEAHVKVVYSKGIEKYEHLDILWAQDAIENVFNPFLGLLSEVGVKPI